MTRRHVPVLLQVLGAFAIAFGVGILAGLAWAVIVIGGEAVVAGSLAEAEAAEPTEPDAAKAA